MIAWPNDSASTSWSHSPASVFPCIRNRADEHLGMNRRSGPGQATADVHGDAWSSHVSQCCWNGIVGFISGTRRPVESRGAARGRASASRCGWASDARLRRAHGTAPFEATPTVEIPCVGTLLPAHSVRPSGNLIQPELDQRGKMPRNGPFTSQNLPFQPKKKPSPASIRGGSWVQE